MLTASLALNNHSLRRCDTSIIADDKERKRENLCPIGKRETRSHITPLEAAVNVSQCQGVFVFPSADQDALELLSVTTALSIYVCVSEHLFAHTHFLTPHTYTENIKSGGDSPAGVVSLFRKANRKLYIV